MPTVGLCSPATTCAAVTTRLRRANQPLPSTPMPHAKPTTLTTEASASSTPRLRTIAGLAGVDGAAGPTIDGNGSTRASRCSRRAGGTASFRWRTISERSTSRLTDVCPGTSRAVAPATQTMTSPVAPPSDDAAERVEEPKRRQLQAAADERADDRPERLQQRRAARTRRRAPRAASTASSSRRSADAARPASPRTRRGAIPASESALAISPRRQPPIARERDDRDARSSRRASRERSVAVPSARARATMPCPRGRSSAG